MRVVAESQVKATIVAETELARLLAREVEREGLRALARKWDLASTTLDRLARGEHRNLPEIETLQKIAIGVGLPLFRIVEMSGVNLNLPQTADERARRLAAVAQTSAPMADLVDRLLQATADDTNFVDGVLSYVEFQIARRKGESSTE